MLADILKKSDEIFKNVFGITKEQFNKIREQSKTKDTDNKKSSLLEAILLGKFNIKSSETKKTSTTSVKYKDNLKKALEALEKTDDSVWVTSLLQEINNPNKPALALNNLGLSDDEVKNIFSAYSFPPPLPNKEGQAPQLTAPLLPVVPPSLGQFEDLTKSSKNSLFSTTFSHSAEESGSEQEKTYETRPAEPSPLLQTTSHTDTKYLFFGNNLNVKFSSKKHPTKAKFIEGNKLHEQLRIKEQALRYSLDNGGRIDETTNAVVANIGFIVTKYPSSQADNNYITDYIVFNVNSFRKKIVEIMDGSLTNIEASKSLLKKNARDFLKQSSKVEAPDKINHQGDYHSEAALLAYLSEKETIKFLVKKLMKKLGGEENSTAQTPDSKGELLPNTSLVTNNNSSNKAPDAPSQTTIPLTESPKDATSPPPKDNLHSQISNNQTAEAMSQAIEPSTPFTEKPVEPISSLPLDKNEGTSQVKTTMTYHPTDNINSSEDAVTKNNPSIILNNEPSEDLNVTIEQKKEGPQSNPITNKTSEIEYKQKIQQGNFKVYAVILDIHSTNSMCKNCAPLVLGAHNSNQIGFLNDLRKELEKKGFNVISKKTGTKKDLCMLTRYSYDNDFLKPGKKYINELNELEEAELKDIKELYKNRAILHRKDPEKVNENFEAPLSHAMRYTLFLSGGQTEKTDIQQIDQIKDLTQNFIKQQEEALAVLKQKLGS